MHVLVEMKLHIIALHKKKFTSCEVHSYIDHGNNRQYTVQEQKQCYSKRYWKVSFEFQLWHVPCKYRRLHFNKPNFTSATFPWTKLYIEKGKVKPSDLISEMCSIQFNH